MKRWIPTLLLLMMFFVFNESKVEEGIIHGKVIDEKIRNELEGVMVRIKGKKNTVVTDCVGEFKIMGNIGDTVVFTKENYLLNEGNVSEMIGNEFFLKYDYKSLLQEIENDSLIVKSRFIETSQPLFIIDGDYSINYLSGITSDSIKKEEIKSVVVFKDVEAQEKFGDFAKNGVVWIIKHCK